MLKEIIFLLRDNLSSDLTKVILNPVVVLPRSKKTFRFIEVIQPSRDFSMIFTEVPKPLGVMFNLDIKKFLPFLSGREFPRGNYLLQDIVSSPGGEFDNPPSRFLVERVFKPSRDFSWSINTS